jgi:hypothetical protein
MNSLQYRRRHTSKPNLESLDDRIVPSAAGSAIHAQALESRAIHIAEVRAARAEQRAEIQAARLQRLELQAQHRAEIQAERARRREAQMAHRAEIRAARIQARQAHFASLQTGRMQTPAAVMHRVAFPQQGRVLPPARAAGSLVTGNPSVTVGQPNATTTAPNVNVPDYTVSTTFSSGATIPSSGAVMGITASGATTPVDINEIKNGPLAKAGQDLIEVYNQYQNSGGGDDFTLDGRLAEIIRIQGNSVGVDVGATPGNMVNVRSTLEALGMQVTATDATTGKIEGFLPIAQLPAVAQNSDVLTLSPNYIPARPAPPTSGFQPR